MKCQDIDKNKLFTISFIKVILQHFEVICGRIRIIFLSVLLSVLILCVSMMNCGYAEWNYCIECH